MTGERCRHDMGAMEALTFAQRVLKESIILLIRNAHDDLHDRGLRQPMARRRNESPAHFAKRKTCGSLTCVYACGAATTSSASPTTTSGGG